MKSYIEECVRIMNNEYMNNPKRIKSDYNREREAIEVYKGRELLELIQNADDELLDGMGKEVRLSFINNILTVSNNGSPFSEDGIDSLMYSNNSSKSKKKDVIGNKGTGFRAILGWANEIKIRSGDLNIRFSDTYAQRVLKEILNNSSNTKTNEEYSAATLVFPEWIDSDEKSGYTTDVSINIHEEESIIKDINKQLDDIDGELLLFLNRTEELCIETEARTVCFIKKYLDENRILIEKYINNILEEKQEWLLNCKNGEFEGKYFSIIIAYNADGLKQKRPVLYSYFPTDVEFPFPVLLHANFNLNSDRNHLIKGNKANRHILEQACKLLIDTALKLTKDEVSYAALLVLAPQRQVTKELSDYRFDEMLLEEIRHSKVFPTVNDQYIEFERKPKFYTSQLSLFLEGEGFDDLLINTENKVICSLIKRLNNGYYPIYDFDELVKKINKWSKSHVADMNSMEKHVYCAIGLLDDYFREMKTQKKMPLLIFDTEGNLVSNEKSIFLRDRNANISTPPNFAQIKFMHPDMRSLFEQITKVGGRKLDGRGLSIKLGTFGVKEYNTPRIIEKMNTVIKKNLDNGKVSRAVGFCELEMKWMWNNRQLLESAGEKIKIYFLTRNGEVKLSDHLYIGKEYGNQVCENLFKGLYVNKFVADIRKHIDTKESTNQEIINFLQTLGLDIYPKQRTKTVRVDKDYKRKLFGLLYFPYNLEGTVFKNLDDMVRRVNNIIAEVTVIEELEDILRNCHTQHIIEWIKADSSLMQILYTKNEIRDSKIKVIWDLKQYHRNLPVDKIYAYIYWVFECIPWIEVGDKRYKVSECIMSKIGRVLQPLLIEPELDVYITNIEGSKSRIRSYYQYMLGNLGIVNDFSELPIKKIYEVLSILPERNDCEAIAKRFYAALIKSDRIIIDEELDCDSYNSFMKSGKVLCNTGYQSIQDSWYLDGKSICDKIANTYNLIEISKRQNSGKIKRLLGVKKLLLKGEVVGKPEIHSENTIFQQDFKIYKTMAFCYRIDNATKDEAKRFADLEIILCIDLSAKYTEKVIELDDYDFILKDTKTFYLKVPKALRTLDEMKQNVSFAAAIANVLCSFIDVTESFAAFRELFGVNNQSRRELIHQVFEDDEILDRAKHELNYSEDTRDEFIRIVSKCTGYEIKEIEEVAKDIDFNNISAIYNTKPIISCFKKMGLDVENYNAESPSTQIDLYNYYQAELVKLRPQYENSYKIHQYYRLKVRGLEEKKKLVELFLSYEYIQVKIINSIHYDCEKELISRLGIDKDLEDIDLISLYNKNCTMWKKGLQNSTFVDEFLNNSSNMSYIYFGEFDELTKIYNEFVVSQVAFEEELENDDDIKPEIVYPNTSPTSHEARNDGKKGKKSTGFTGSRNLERIGLKGEKKVYDILKKQYPSARWVSENAKIMEVNPEGRAGLGYDIEYTDENGGRIYIEVKTSKTNEIVFYMSENEFDFAQKHDSEYKIYYVSEVCSKQPKIFVLENVFDNNHFNYEKYALDTKKEYKIMASLDQ